MKVAMMVSTLAILVAKSNQSLSVLRISIQNYKYSCDLRMQQRMCSLSPCSHLELKCVCGLSIHGLYSFACSKVLANVPLHHLAELESLHRTQQLRTGMNLKIRTFCRCPGKMVEEMLEQGPYVRSPLSTVPIVVLTVWYSTVQTQTFHPS